MRNFKSPHSPTAIDLRNHKSLLRHSLVQVFIRKQVQLSPIGQNLFMRNFTTKMIAFKKTLDVEARPTCNDGELSSGCDLRDGLFSFSYKIKSRVRLGHLPHIDQMMGSCSLLFWCRLGCSNVQLAIDLLTIATDDFTIEGLRQLDRKSCFSNRSRSHNHNYLGFHRFSLQNSRFFVTIYYNINI